MNEKEKIALRWIDEEREIVRSPKVSILTPVYNAEKFLDECIQSMLNQTFKDFEFILINDCSTDNSLNIIKKYKNIDRRIVLIDSKKKLNVSETRNLGLKVARGKYIANMDADDISFPERLKKEFNFLEKNPHIFLVGSSAIYIDENGNESRRFRKYNNYKILAWRLPQSCSIVNSSIMYRNEGFYYNEEYPAATDYNFYLEALDKKKNLTNLPEFLVKYREQPNSISVAKRRTQEFYRDKTMDDHKHLNKKINLIKRIYYSSILLLHYIRTRNEKKIRKLL